MNETRSLLTRAGPAIGQARKQYTTPKLTVHGNVERITQQGGSTATDVPFGTPVVDGNVASVAS